MLRDAGATYTNDLEDFIRECRKVDFVTLRIYDPDMMNRYLVERGIDYEGLLEEVGQTHGVVAGHVDEQGRLFHVQMTEGVSGRAGALKRVDEAHAEDVFLALGDQRVGAAGAHLGDARLFGHFTAGHGQGGTVGTDDGVDFFLRSPWRSRSSARLIRRLWT